MNVLENWIENLLGEPIDLLNATYLDDGIVREELDSLPLPLSKRGYTVEASYVSDYVLDQLHTKICAEPCEEAIWSTMVWFLAHPLPFDIAHDLVERGISTAAMAHTRQVDEIQWRLATIHEDALYTLITERYQRAG
ncbi:MAG: hypothetical protein EOO38_18645 [Cytophagaceae bacterium]|nr:MAG: hypothetical protein EOO38_18645 [Cytophagaceae bacterium]